MKQWEVVIGLETHVQLSTNSKIFSRSSTAFGAAPNTQASVIDLALPGTLPSMNFAAVDKAIAFGLAVNANINAQSIFARKNYFYPDLPKNYQISQMDHPILLGGAVSFLVGEETKTIQLTRAHLEEDAGKSNHGILHPVTGEKHTGIDLNRAGTPLLEIVTEPDMRSAAEAVGYAKALHSLVVWLGICDGNMQEGSFRVDVNISVRPKGQKEFGTRAEIKNINSFRFIERAIHVEVQRQIECLEDGGTLIQETRLYDPDRDETRSMRSKEDAHDYRYFPDPDLPPLMVDAEWINRVRSALPELPQVRSNRYMQEYQLSQYDALVLTSAKSTSDYFEAVAQRLPKDQVKLAANWVMGELASALNREELDISDSKVSPEMMAALILRIIDNTLSNKTARDVFAELWINGGEVDAIINEKGLKQINDEGAIVAIVAQVLSQNSKIVEEYKSGKEKVFGSLVGLVMKEAKGKANPQQVNAILKAQLNG